MTDNSENLIIQQARQDVKLAAQTLSNDIQMYKAQKDVAWLLSNEPKLEKTVNDLVSKLTVVTNFKESGMVAGDPLKEIDINAANLLEVTRTWATLRDGLDLRNVGRPFWIRLLLAIKLLGPRENIGESLIAVTAIGDRIIGEIYKIAVEKKLNLRDPEAEVVTVLREERIHSEAFGEPTPFIVGPLWGYNQAWNYIAYAHEVGHHIYHNVNGLDCELFVHVILNLGAHGYSHSDISIWGSWLEEIFADLFCLLQVGPAAIHAGQRVALWLTAVPRRNQPPDDTLTQVLLTSRDASHPVPYLRIRLGLITLELLKEYRPSENDPEVQKLLDELRSRWDDLVKQHADVYIHDKKEDTEKILGAGELVLRTVLTTRLYALADKSDGNTPSPRSILSIFYDENRFIPKVVDDLKRDILSNVQTRGQGFTVEMHPKNREEKWNILAAAEFARDKLHDEKSLQDLHNETIAYLNQ